MNLTPYRDITVSPKRSTYYTFTKALKDFDKSVMEETPYYFTRLVALNLPIWKRTQDGNFMFNFRMSTSDPAGDITTPSNEFRTASPSLELEEPDSMNPNMVIPRLFTYYMENIIRQSRVMDDETTTYCEEIVELAFWKTLKLMGITNDELYGTIDTPSTIVTFMNKMNVSNFIDVSNNHGWCEVVGSIPNKCPKLIMLRGDNVTVNSCWRSVAVGDTISADENHDSAIYDTDSGGYSFDMHDSKLVIDFNEIENNTDHWDTSSVSEFEFNTLLVFYTDATGVQKLHGVQFMFPFERFIEVGRDEYRIETLNHITNQIQTFGYSFKFLMKSCNNDASVGEVYEINEGTFYDAFEECMGNFNSFLETQIQQGRITR